MGLVSVQVHKEAVQMAIVGSDLVCPICDTQFKVKPYRIKDTKTSICCSRFCAGVLKRTTYMGNKNLGDYNSKGTLNLHHKGDTISLKRGTNKYYFDYAPWHPFQEVSGRVRQHRLVVELNYRKYNPEYFISVRCFDDVWRMLLKPKYDVHHSNRDTLDNNLGNLIVLSRGSHCIEHFKERFYGRTSKGQFKGKAQWL